MTPRQPCAALSIWVAAFAVELPAWAADRRAGGTERSQADRTEGAERDPVEASVDATQLGAVTWVDARVDIPVGGVVGGLAVFPQGALLHVAPQAGGNDGGTVEEWHGFAGAGVTWRPTDRWQLELSAMYAPPADDVESLAGELEVERDIGGDDESDGPRPLELKGAISVQHVRWEDGNGPAGSDVVQVFADLDALWRPLPRLEVHPRAMFFIYDKSLNSATADRLGSIAVLAEVGTYAPLAFGEVTLGYSFLRWWTPSISVGEIVYASAVGDATEASLGARVRVSRAWTVAVAGGFLWNRVRGPLVPPDAAAWLPVGQLEIAATF